MNVDRENPEVGEGGLVISGVKWMLVRNDRVVA